MKCNVALQSIDFIRMDTYRSRLEEIFHWVIRKINLEMSLLIPRSVVRDLRTCFDSWAGIRQRAKPLRHPMPSEERWAGQISMSEILEGKLKIEDLARISSTSVCTPLPVISPREFLWRDISLLQVSKGTKSWTLVLRGSWPHWPPTSRWNGQFLSIFQLFNRWRRAIDSISAKVNKCVLITRDAEL